jgi:hypothetical protein
MLADKQFSGCVGESGKTPQSYVAHAFDLRQMRLHTGEQMTVAVALVSGSDEQDETRISRYTIRLAIR